MNEAKLAICGALTSFLVDGFPLSCIRETNHEGMHGTFITHDEYVRWGTLDPEGFLPGETSV